MSWHVQLQLSTVYTSMLLEVKLLELGPVKAKTRADYIIFRAGDSSFKKHELTEENWLSFLVPGLWSK